MRNRILLGSVSAGFGLLLVGGCNAAVPRAGGLAEPAGGSTAVPSPSGPTRAVPSSPVQISTVPTLPATPRATPPASSATAAGGLVIGPLGLGRLTMGMTSAQARSSGEIVAFQTGDPCDLARLPNAPTDEIQVDISHSHGVVAIYAYGRMHTPEGIRIGSTLAAVKRAYRNLDDGDDGTLASGQGRLWANSHDGDHVSYRMAIRKNVVTELGLEDDRQDCYE